MHSVLHVILERYLGGMTVAWLGLVADLAALGSIPSVLLRRRGRPLAALAWVFALVALPYLGVAAWWLLGRPHLERMRRRRRAASEEFCGCREGGDHVPSADAVTVLGDVLPFARHGSRWSEGVFPPTAGNRVRLLRGGREAFAAFEEAIASAQKDVRALFYIWNDDATGRRMAGLLGERARSGVAVHVLVDAIGSSRFSTRVARDLERTGAHTARFLPVRFAPWAPTFNFRNHRKLLVVDGSVAFVGGMNVGDEYATRWYDLAARIEGPAVRQLDEVFAEDWFFAAREDIGSAVTGEVAAVPGEAIGIVAAGPELKENRIHDALFLAISGSRRRVWLTTPYFIPSLPILAALRGAAQRGVDVRLLVPARSDVPLVACAARAYFPALLSAGGHVHAYNPSVLHAKALVVDGDLAMLGSANVDMRSFRLNFELVGLVRSRALNASLARVFEEDLSVSTEVALDSFRSQGPIGRLAEAAAQVLSPLL